MQLIILGMHRSGTSMQTRLLNLAGAYFAPEGSSTGANEENPKGFWERRDVRIQNDSLLHSAGCDWNRAVDFDEAKVPAEALARFNRAASRIVLNMDAYRPWVLKEPRLCLLLPMWRKLLECPVGVHVFRHPVEVAASLQRRNGIPVEVGLAMWKLYVASAVNAAQGMPAVISFHRDFVTDPYDALTRLVEQLQQIGVNGLRMPSRQETEAFVSRELYRERLPQLDFDPSIATPQIELFEEIRRTGQLPGHIALTEEETRLLRNYESSLPPPLDPDVDKEPGPLEKARSTIAELQASLRKSEAEAKNHEAEAKEYEAEAKKYEARIRTLDERQSGMHERLQNAHSTVERLEAVAAAEKLDSARKTQEIARLTRLLVSREHQLHEQRVVAHEQKASARLAQKKLAERSREIEQLRTRLDVTTGRSQAQMEALRAELARVHRSLSWKLAAPARWASRRIAAARGIGLAGDVRLVLDSGLFDAAWYVNTYPDVAQSGMDPVEHYLLHGADEGRSPGPGFNTGYYVEKYPDVAGSGMNPLLHFIRHGRSEGRRPL